MSIFNVPQFIDIEDKIVGPLTAKELGWVAAGSIVMLIAWFSLDFSAFIVLAIVVGLPIGALAFYKPNGQPFTVFIISAIAFFLNPKIYVWKRVSETQKISAKPKVKKNATISTSSEKDEPAKRIQDIAQILDSGSKR